MIIHINMKQQASLLSFFGKGGKKKCKQQEAGDDSNCSDSRKQSKKPPASNANDTTSTDTLLINSSTDKANEGSTASAIRPPQLQVTTTSPHAPPKSEADSSKQQPRHGAPSNDNPVQSDATVDTTAESSDSSSDSEGEKEDNNLSTTTTSSSTIIINDNKHTADGASNSQTSTSTTTVSKADEKYKGLSDYEILREKNIERNNARLKELGLLVGLNATSATLQQRNNGGSSQQQKKKKRKRAKNGSNTASNLMMVPTRRSGRLKKQPVNTVSNADLELVNEEKGVSFEMGEKEEEEVFTVSPLIEYQMSTSATTSATTTTNTDTNSICNAVTEQHEGQSITTLTPSSTRLLPPSGLNAIYSLQFYPTCWGGSEAAASSTTSNGSSSSSSWLVGAGKAGLISLWDCSNNQMQNHQDDESMEANESSSSYIEPVLSWKGHSGRWIADARFVPPVPSYSANSNSSIPSIPSRLLTAGNDGTVCHWDLTLTTKTGAPKLLSQSGKTLHGSGIFSMDVSYSAVSSRTSGSSSSFHIVTGSKDKTIALTTLDRLDNTTSTEPIWRSNFHTAKVGSVCFSSSSSLIASASDDGLVAVHDSRLDGHSGKPVSTLEGAHIKPHSAVWKPDSDRIFMTGEFEFEL